MVRLIVFISVFHRRRFSTFKVGEWNGPCSGAALVPESQKKGAKDLSRGDNPPRSVGLVFLFVRHFPHDFHCFRVEQDSDVGRSVFWFSFAGHEMEAGDSRGGRGAFWR